MWLYGLYRAAVGMDSWWALVNVAVWAVSSGYCEGYLLGTCKCVRGGSSVYG